MWKTVLILILTLIIVPLVAFYFDEPLVGKKLDVLWLLVKIYLGAALGAFALSTVTKNYSQVDKLWSVIPMIYAWVVAYQFEFEPRVLLMAILVSVWGIRLSYNFTRRGGFSWKFWTGEEDYRWEVLRAKPEFQGKIKWMLFNLFFISLYQMGLILLFTLPILKAAEGTPLGIFDYLLAALFIVLVVIETIADQQQWNFQSEKYRRINAKEELGEPYSDGFISSGLWGMARHPNYGAEQAIWIIFYLFTIPATGIWLNWSIVGCLLLLVLFKSSSDFSEEISASKYPKYKEYQKTVGRFLPKLF